MDYTSFFNNLTMTNPDALPNDPFEGVDRMRTRYDQAGVQAPAPEKSTSLVDTALKVLDYPGNVVRSAVFGTKVSDIGQALLGKQTIHTRDFLTNQGMADGWKKTGLGLLGDMLLDPLMLTGSGLIKNGGKAALESGVAKTIADKTAGSVIEQTAKQTGQSIDRVHDALTTFGVKPEMNSIEAGKAMLGGKELNGQTMASAANLAQTPLAVATSKLTTANRSMAGLLGTATSGIKGKNAALRTELAEGISSGRLTGSNAWRVSEPKNYVELQARLQTLMSKDLDAAHMEKLLNLHVADSPQIHTILNIAEQYGTKIKDFDSLFDMSKKFGESDFVDKVVKANERLVGAQAARDESHIRAVFANNLMVDIDKLGNKRFWGIMTPTGKTILPLIDVSPVANALSKAGDTAYANIPGYKGLSDWFRTAITRDITRDVYMQGGERLTQALHGKAIIKEFNQLKQILPQVTAEFVRSGLGQELMNADERVLIGAVYGIERNRLRNVTVGGVASDIQDPYTAYIWGNIADDVRTGTAVSPGELEFARNYILETNGEEGLKHIHDTIIDPFLARGSKLTSEEIETASKYGDKAMFNTDVMLAHEKLQGLDAPPEGFKSWYVYHMYEYGNSSLSLAERASVGPQSARSAGAMVTNTSLRASKARDYDTIGEAVAHDLRISKPVDNLVDLSAARFSASVRYGMNRGLINGIDGLFESSLNTELKKLASEKGLGYEVTERLPDAKGKLKDVTKDVSPKDMERSQELLSGGQATVDTLVKALGGRDGLKALKEVIRKADNIHPSDLRGGEWVAIDSVFGLTQAGGSGGLYYARKELVPHIEALNRPIANTVAMRQLLEFTDEATRYIKTFQTTLNPPFIIRNLVGEGHMSFVNGTTIEALKDSGNILRVINKQTEMNGKSMYVQEALARLKVMRESDTVTINGTRMTTPEARRAIRTEQSIDLGNGVSKTIQEVYDDAMRHGLINLGHNADVSTETARVAQAVQPSTWTGRASKEFKKDALGPVRAYKSVMESATGGIDSVFRLADYIHNLRQGMTATEAALRVKQFHVDYTDLTQFERGIMRRIVPYYTFMRKNTPIQLRLMVERPAYFGTVGKLLDASYAHFGDPSTPDYLNKNLAFPIYKDDDGNVTYLNWNLPMADLSKLKLNLGDTAKEYMQTLHPGIKAPFELATGKNIAFGTDVKPVDYLSNQLGGASTAYKAASQLATPNEEFQGKYKAPRYAVPLFQSLVPTVNPEKENLSRAYAYREQLLADISKRKKAGNPIPEVPAKPNYGVNFGLDSYDINPNYAHNKDWIGNHKNQFTP